MSKFDIAPAAGRLIQTAFITKDIHASMQTMTRTMGVGPWFLRERGVFPRQIYRGQPSSTALAIAMGYAGDMQFESHGVKVVVDPKSLPYLEGTELDYAREGLNEGFKFRNPNVKDQCGCGESFNV